MKNSYTQSQFPTWPMIRHKGVVIAGSLLFISSLFLNGCGPAPSSMENRQAAPAAESGASYDYGSDDAASEEEAMGSAETSYSTGGTSTVNGAAYDMTFFDNYGVNPFIDTEDDRLSTFGMDVDTASYTVARRYIRDGNLPDPDSVRTEEFLNYFKRDYTPPQEGAFAIHLEGAPSPFGDERHHLLRVGLQGKVINPDDRKDASLVFVIDASGSMNREDRLTTVKRSLRMLVDELRPADEVAIVVYNSNTRAVLQPTRADEKDTILRAIDNLRPEGSTNAEAGIIAGYQVADQMLAQSNGDRIVRLILCSDGVANVGNTGPDTILAQVQRYVDQGVSLSTVGFGMGNYNDVLMERLANDGDGNYAYVDNLDQAHRFFVEDLTGTLQTIAKDAKVQVDFNPDVVSRYRLLGYENRNVADDDFRDDSVDAGEVGAGHSVTALYEVKFHESTEDALLEKEIATVNIRYQDMDDNEVVEVNRALTRDHLNVDFTEASTTFQHDAIIAEFAEVLRESYWAQDSSLDAMTLLVDEVFTNMPQNEDIQEFLELFNQALDIERS